MTSEGAQIDGYDTAQSEMMQEMCILVNQEDEIIGSGTKLSVHRGDGARHRAFSVLIYDSKGRLLVQRRSSEKITFPNVWANSCCSHPLDIDGERDSGHGAENAARRKLHQELGIPEEVSSNWDFRHIGKMEYSARWDSEWVEWEIDHILVVKEDVVINHNENEISDVLWADVETLEKMMAGEGRWAEEVIAPWFRLIWRNFIRDNSQDVSAIVNSKFPGIVQCGEVGMDGKSVRPGHNLLEALSERREIVEQEIMTSLGKMGQETLYSAMTHLFKGGGKRLRAILPRLVAEALGGANEGHYTLGASIEIIHNFTLIHDDIIDQDPIRRGLDAVHVAYDDATAINAGDAMLAVGFEILAESDKIPSEKLGNIITAIGEMVRKVAEGQQEDIEFENRESVTENEYIAMIAGKTSAMFETCARTGAILAQGNDDEVGNMAEWGLNLGICFQLMDDLIDLTGDTKTLGKPAGSDIVQGKRTLIAIHALQCDQPLPYFRKVYASGECSDEDLEMAVKELEDSGSVEYARDRALYHHSIAHQCLDKLDSNEAVGVLRELTDFQIIRIN